MNKKNYNTDYLKKIILLLEKHEKEMNKMILK